MKEKPHQSSAYGIPQGMVCIHLLLHHYIYREGKGRIHSLLVHVEDSFHDLLQRN